MAKGRIAFVLAVAIPLLPLISHPELKRLLLWDVLTITRFNPTDAMSALPQPKGTLREQLAKVEAKPLEERWRSYEQLYRQTGQVWLGLFALREAMGAIPLERPEINGRLAPLQHQLLRQQQDAKDLLRLALELSERDADNALPLLAKAYALFVLQQDAEALQAIRNASLRPAYRTGDKEWLQLKAPHSLTAEERVWQSASIASFHPCGLHPCGLWRMMQLLIQYHAAQAEAKGNFAVALQLAEDVIRIGATMRDHGYWLLDQAMGLNLQQLAFSGKTRGLSPGEERMLSARERFQVLAHRFAAFAQKHGRPDLAERVLEEAKVAAAIYELLERYQFEDFFLADFRLQGAHQLITARLMGLSLVVSAFLLLLTALLAVAFLWRAPLEGDRYGSLTATLVVAGLPVASVSWSLWGAFTVDFWELMAPKEPKIWLGVAGIPIATLWLLLSVCFGPALWLMRNIAAWRNFCLALGGLGLLGLLEAILLSPPTTNVTSALVIGVLSFFVVMGTIGAIFWAYQQMKSATPFRRIAGGVLLVILIGFLLYASLGLVVFSEAAQWRLPFPSDLAFNLLPVPFIAALLLLLMWGIWAHWGPKEQQRICRLALWRLREAAALLALVCWWGYGVVSVGSLPLRTKLHQTLDNMIAYGEVKLLQKLFSAP